MSRTMKVGDHVVYIDSRRRRHNALVTAIHGGHPTHGMSEFEVEETDVPCINLVHVSDDEAKEDTYGRQLERANRFAFPDEL